MNRELKIINIPIPDTLTGERLDQVLVLLVPGLSRSSAASVLRAGEIRVCGADKKPGYRVKPGDVISGTLPDPDTGPPDAQAESIPLDILFEDEHLLVVHKPPGLVVHPAPGNASGTLVNALLYHFPELETTGGIEFRAGIVHRLDKDTSGVMVIARNETAFAFLQQEFRQRRVSKRYLALVTGELPQNSGDIQLPIGRHPTNRKRMAVVEGGRSAHTLWWLRKRFDGINLVEIELKTGRTHQIRVHFRAMGFPLLGDKVYGFKNRMNPRTNPGSRFEAQAPRQMLHSWKLSFIHPWSGCRVHFRAPLPDDFRKILRRLHCL